MAPLLLPAPRPAVAAPPWMITFADLLSLLLAFFAMLFATTTIDRDEWRQRVAPIATYLGGKAPVAPGVVVVRPAPVERDQAYVAALVEHLAAASTALRGAMVRRHEHWVALALPAPLLAADRQPAAFADLGRLLAGLDNRIELVVHAAVADGEPERWQRPADRALALATVLAPLAGGRAVAAAARLDLPAGTADDRVEILVTDVHAAP